MPIKRRRTSPKRLRLPTPPPGGRPTKCTPERVGGITLAIRGGNFVETAAAHAGVDKTTLYDWMRRGRAELDRIAAEDDRPPPQRMSRRRRFQDAERALERDAEKPYAKLVEEIDRALADAEVTRVARISTAGISDWRADAWWLERRAPDRWGKRETLTHQGPSGGPVAHKVEAQTTTTVQEAAPLPAVDLQKLSTDELLVWEQLLEKAAAKGPGDADGAAG